MKISLKKSGLILAILLSLNLYSCNSEENKTTSTDSSSESSDSSELPTTSTDESDTVTTSDESDKTEETTATEEKPSTSTSSSSSSNTNTNTSNNNISNPKKTISQDDAYKKLNDLIDIRYPISISPANDKNLPNDAKTNEVKKQYYFFFYDDASTGTTIRLFLVNKTTGEVKEFSQNCEVENLRISSVDESKKIVDNHVKNSIKPDDKYTVKEADSKYFAESLNIDKTKVHYHVFFLEYENGGAQVFIVNKVTGTLFKYNELGEISYIS